MAEQIVSGSYQFAWSQKDADGWHNYQDVRRFATERLALGRMEQFCAENMGHLIGNLSVSHVDDAPTCHEDPGLDAIGEHVQRHQTHMLAWLDAREKGASPEQAGEIAAVAVAAMGG